MAGPKICNSCGEDCSDRPRTKDPRGRYYCTACYEERRRAALHGKHAAPQAAPARTNEPTIPPSDDPGHDLLDDLIEAPADTTPCPSCGAALAAAAVVCVQCGFDRRSGGHVDAHVETAQHSMPGAPAGALPQSTYMTWLFDLFVRPRRCFRTFVVESAPVLTAGTAWICGMAGVMDRMDTRAATGQLSGRTSPFPDTWPAHWGMYLALGLVGALILYAVGGWWYRVRLAWSGAKDADATLARRVFIFASLVYALPMVLGRLAGTMMHATPSANLTAAFNVIDGSILFFLFWSIVVSYLGVRTAFEVGTIRSVIWFIAVPVGWYAIVLVGAFVAMLFLSTGATADTQHTQHFRSRSLSFQYPGNWLVSTDDPEHDPDGLITIEPWQYAYANVMLYESEDPLEDELTWSRESAEEWVTAIREVRRIDALGRYRGVGAEYTIVTEGESGRMRIFIADIGDGRYLELSSMRLDEDRERVEPGFDLIERTIVVFPDR